MNWVSCEDIGCVSARALLGVSLHPPFMLLETLEAIEAVVEREKIEDAQDSIINSLQKTLRKVRQIKMEQKYYKVSAAS